MIIVYNQLSSKTSVTTISVCSLITMAQPQTPDLPMYDGMSLATMTDVETIRRASGFDYVEGDVLIASYPKTGTTWMGQLVSLIQSMAADHKVDAADTFKRIPYLEFIDGHTPVSRGLDFAEKMKRPAVFKTHLKGNLLPRAVDSGNVKVIVTIRNPKDTLVSLYHFYQKIPAAVNFESELWDDFFDLYRNKRLIYGDFFDWYDSWLPHLNNKEHILLVKYEDMKTDLKSVIREVATFLGKDLSKEQIKSCVEQATFSNMKSTIESVAETDSVTKQGLALFMRNGKTGKWDSYFSESQSNLVDQAYVDRLKNKGIILDFH